MLLKRLLAYGLYVALAATLVYSFFTALGQSGRVAARACEALQPEHTETTARDFTLPDLAGKQQRLAQRRGKVVLLHFWATWCPPCIEELPSLYRLQRALADAPFELVTVSADEKAATVREFFSQNKVPALPVLMDPAQEIPHAYGTEKYPESFLIDPRGVIRYRFINQRDWGSPEALSCIRTLLR